MTTMRNFRFELTFYHNDKRIPPMLEGKQTFILGYGQLRNQPRAGDHICIGDGWDMVVEYRTHAVGEEEGRDLLVMLRIDLEAADHVFDARERVCCALAEAEWLVMSDGIPN